jgi:hypothetical protein
MERLMGRHGRGLGENINIKTVNLADELQNKDGIPTQEPVGLSGSSVCTWQSQGTLAYVKLVWFILIPRG